MSELTKTRIIDINTQQAQKNVESLTKSFVPLKKQIKDLITEMGQLEKGTEEYNQAALKLANLQQKQREIMEAGKYSNKDFGATMQNLTRVSTGLIGGLNAISASMALLSNDSEEVTKALQKIQLVMAVVQGMTVIYTAVKSLKGLFNVFGSVGNAASEAVSDINDLGKSLDGLGSKKVDVVVDGSEAVKEVKTIETSIDTISDKKVELDVKSDTTGVKEVKSELSSIPTEKDVKIDVVGDSTEAELIKSEIETIPAEKEVVVDVKSDAGEVELTKAELETIPAEKEVVVDVKSDAVEEVATTKAALDTLPEKVTVDIDSDGVDSMTEGVEKLTKAESNLTTTGTSVAKTNKTIATTGKAATVGLSGLTKGIRAAAAALKSFIVSNPILMGIATAIAAVAVAVALLNKRFEENGRIAKEEADILTQANAQFEDQSVRLNVLLKTAKDHNQSLEERKKATEELNKIVPEYNAQINETTGALEANNEALTTYINNLKEKLTLEAYESKIKEYLEKQVELEEEINDIENTGWWFVKKRIKDRRKEIAELGTDIDRLYGKIANLDLSKALASNKVENETKKTGNKIKEVVKTVEDAIKELKKTLSDFWNSFFDARQLQRKVKGISSELGNLRDAVLRLNVSYGLGDKLTDEFKDFIRNVKKSDYKLSDFFSMEDIFKDVDFGKELEQKSQEAARKIEEVINQLKGKTGNLSAAQIKSLETQQKYWESQLADINKQIEGYNQLIDAADKYRDSILEELKAQEERQSQITLNNKLMDIEKTYLQQLYGNDYLADINKTIASEEAEIETLKKSNKVLEDRVAMYNSNDEVAKRYAKEIKEWEQQIYENQVQITNKEIQLDKSKYDRRLQEAKHYYEELDKEVTQQQRKLENENITRGFGTPSYSTQYQQQKLLVDRLNSEMETLKQQHDLQLIEEEEFNAKMLELKTHLIDESAKLDDYRIDRAVNAVNTYMNVFSSVTSSISSILQEQMNKYDENSEEYKQLQVTNSWITTLSGTLGAFMSGFQSGIPWPYNLIVAAAMGATTFAAGAAQISNIQNGTHSNALTSGASSSGQSTYETEVYRQQADWMGEVKDQRVYVTENDISSTQRRVSVREENATF